MYRRVYDSSDGDAQTHSNSIVGHVPRIQSDVLAKLTVTAVCVNGKIEFKHFSARCLEALFGDANVRFLKPIKNIGFVFIQTLFLRIFWFGAGFLIFR